MICRSKRFKLRFVIHQIVENIQWSNQTQRNKINEFDYMLKQFELLLIYQCQQKNKYDERSIANVDEKVCGDAQKSFRIFQ